MRKSEKVFLDLSKDEEQDHMEMRNIRKPYRRYLNPGIYTELRASQLDGYSNRFNLFSSPFELLSSDHDNSSLSNELSLDPAGIMDISPYIGYEKLRTAKSARVAYSEQRKIMEKQQRLKEFEERKKLDALEMQKWMELKTKKSDITKVQNNIENSASKTFSSRIEEKEEKYKAWLAKKSQEAKEKLKKQKEAEEKTRQQAEQRKRQSEEAYKKWLEKFSTKPKPLPVKKEDTDSLRGTFTADYWNPNQWVDLTDTEKRDLI